MPWNNVEDLPTPEPTKKEIQEVKRYAKQTKTRARFYADENFPARAIAILRERGLDVLTAQEAGRRGHPDQNQIAEARRLGRILITCDRDYLDGRRYPLTTAHAVVVFDFRRGTDSEILSAFRCLAYPVEFPQFYDKWFKIHAHPGEWTERMRFLDGTSLRERHRIHRGKLQVWVDENERRT